MGFAVVYESKALISVKQLFISVPVSSYGETFGLPAGPVHSAESLVCVPSEAGHRGGVPSRAAVCLPPSQSPFCLPLSAPALRASLPAPSCSLQAHSSLIRKSAPQVPPAHRLEGHSSSSDEVQAPGAALPPLRPPGPLVPWSPHHLHPLLPQHPHLGRGCSSRPITRDVSHSPP